MDAAYIPFETNLLIQAKQAGCCIIPGIEMLIHQGLTQNKLFSRQAPPSALVMDVVRKEYYAMIQREPNSIRDAPGTAEIADTASGDSAWV